MKTIFIATDFSAASRNASLYGIQLANAFHANVVLFNAFQVSVVPTDAINIVSAAEIKEKIEGLFQAELSQINPSGTVAIETICEESTTINAILEKANDKNADVIIIGMKSKGKSIRQIFGSTATALARKTNIPLLVIPETTEYSVPKIITLASDITEESASNIHLLYFLRQIAEKFESSIFVVRVGKLKINELPELNNRNYKLNCLLAKLEVQYKYADDHNITHALTEFVKEQKSDIIAMIPHKHDFIDRLFIKSETKEMLFHTSIPLLILPEKPVNKNSHKIAVADRRSTAQ